MGTAFQIFKLPVNAGSAPAGYADKVLALSPTAYWQLNETLGSTAADSSGNGYNGTYDGVTLGGDSFVDGSNAALLDGIDDSIVISSMSGQWLVPSTWSFWVKVPSSFWTNYTFFFLDQHSSSHRIAVGRISTTAQNALGVFATDGLWQDYATGLSTTDWLHIAIKFLSSSVVMRINATDYSNSATPDTDLPTTILIGARYDEATNWANFSTAHWAYFPYELSNAQIDNLAQVPT